MGLHGCVGKSLPLLGALSPELCHFASALPHCSALGVEPRRATACRQRRFRRRSRRALGTLGCGLSAAGRLFQALSEQVEGSGCPKEGLPVAAVEDGWLEGQRWVLTLARAHA